MSGHPFDEATAVEPLGDGVHRAICSTDWSAPRGPNGGYLAAIVLNALRAEVPDQERAPRSLTLHYLRPPAAGAVEVAVTVERSGRKATNLTARLAQEGRLCVLAVAAFATDFPDEVRYTDAPPAVKPRDAIEPMTPVEPMPPIAWRFDQRFALGPFPFTGADEARTGGWLSFHEPRPLDAAALAMYTDAWLPAPFTRLTTPVPVPTLDLTIHFRSRVPLPSDDGSGAVLIDVRSRVAQEGFCDEDVDLWSPEGVLLAQSRQLAVLRP